MTKIYKHTVVLTVLSEEKDLSQMSLDDITYEINEGDSIGTFNVQKVEEVPRKNLHKELVKVGNDGSFFDPL